MDSASITLRQLRALAIVAEERHFGRAARRLHLAQPALSRQIQALEVAFGAPLLLRDARGVVPTPIGADVLHEARALLGAARQALEEARGADAGVVGTCTVGVSRAVLHSEELERAVRAVDRQLPNVTLVFREFEPPFGRSALLEGEADLLLGHRPTANQPLHWVPLWNDLLDHVLISERHPLASRARIDEAELDDDVYLDAGSDPLRADGSARATGSASRRIRLSALVAFIEAGYGWTLVSRRAYPVPPPGTRLVPLGGTPFVVPCGLLTRVGDTRELVRSVADVMRAALSRGAEAPAHTAQPASTSCVAPVGDTYPPIELRDFRYFSTVVTSGSIGAAAQCLGITQPVVSRQLRALEATVGVPLLARNHDGIAPTAAGARLARDAAALLDAADRLLVSTRQRATRAASREVRVATVSTPLGTRLVGTMLRLAAERAPELDLELEDVRASDQSRELLEYRIDVGIAASIRSRGPALLVYERILHDPIDCALIPRDHPLAQRESLDLAELRDLPLLLAPRESSPTFDAHVRAAVAALSPDARIVEAGPTLRERWLMTSLGRGWCLGFTSQRTSPPPGIAAVPARGLELPWSLELLCRAGEERDEVLAVIALVREAAEAIVTATPRSTGV